MIKTMIELTEFINREDIANLLLDENSSDLDQGIFAEIYRRESLEKIDQSRYPWLKALLLKYPLTSTILERRAYKNYNKTRFVIDSSLSPIDVYQDIKENIQAYSNVYELLSDERSKEIFVAVQMYRMTRDFKYISWIYDAEKKQYFAPEINLNSGEVVVDCGAYIGDTLLDFIEQRLIPRKYFLFEPNDKNYAKLMENVEKASKDGVQTIPYKAGVFNDNTKLYFTDAADSSCISDNATGNSIDVVALDKIINEPVSFIKMDIEGAELEALEGAKDLIVTYKPKLAICLYHKQSDFYKIPLFIKQICPEYKHFLIRHYSLCRIETVLYVY